MILKPAGYWFKHRGYVEPELDRRTSTTTGHMLYQIMDPRPIPVILPENLPPTPPPPSLVAAMRRRETYTNRLSEHDNRNVIQNFGEYFGRGFGKRLLPQSARRDHDWILSHDPMPAHPDRSVTQRDYRGLPGFDPQSLATPLSTTARKKSSGDWMTSCYDDWRANTERTAKRVSNRDVDSHMTIHPWNY